MASSPPVPQIDASELKATLNAMGQDLSEEEIFQMISQVDDDNSGEIEFAEFFESYRKPEGVCCKGEVMKLTLWKTFVALGGNSDKTGENFH